MILEREQLKLYAITDNALCKGKSLAEMVEQAILGGVTIIQLREKNISDDELKAKALEILPVCHKYDVPLIINDNYKVAIECGADGVHVGIEDSPVEEIRRIAGDNFIIGATAKTVLQAQLAEKSGADYLGVGAVFPSPTKTDALRITSDKLSEICSSVSIPVVAIGGISLENVSEIKGCGQCGIAVVSAVFGKDDIKSSAQQLLDAVF